MVRGESHYFLGTRYRLRVIQQEGAPRVVLRNRSAMELYVQPGTSAEQRERVLHRWYRQQLKELIPPLLEKWQSALGIQVADWRIKKMKTKWGTREPSFTQATRRQEKCTASQTVGSPFAVHVTRWGR
jgi:predicted metal-dependent hydrolase